MTPMTDHQRGCASERKREPQGVMYASVASTTVLLWSCMGSCMGSGMFAMQLAGVESLQLWLGTDIQRRARPRPMLHPCQGSVSSRGKLPPAACVLFAAALGMYCEAHATVHTAHPPHACVTLNCAMPAPPCFLLLVLRAWCCWRAGISLLLQDLMLLNVTLVSPNQADLNKAFLPAHLELSSAGLLSLQDVVLVVSDAAIQDYITFLRSVPRVTSYTDNTTFLHVRNYSNAPFGVVEARSLTLVAPRRASVRGTPLTLLAPALLPRNYSTSSTGGRGRGCSDEEIASISKQQRIDKETVAAACGDSAGIITATDSYVLGANNSTMVPLLQQLASGVEDQ